MFFVLLIVCLVVWWVRWSFAFVFFKQNTAYGIRISDWSSDVCSSDLARRRTGAGTIVPRRHRRAPGPRRPPRRCGGAGPDHLAQPGAGSAAGLPAAVLLHRADATGGVPVVGLHLALVRRPPRHALHRPGREIGRASCGESVCQYV